MAYIDQDRSREKTISGAISVAVIGIVGYGLVSGLAMRIEHKPIWIIPTDQWKTPLPPPEKKLPPKHTEKTAERAPTADPQPIPVPPPVIDPVLTLPGPISLPPIPTPMSGGGSAVPPQPPSVDHAARATPRGNPGDWVTTDDYPPAAVRAGIEGRTSFRLDVGADGKATGCTVVASSGSDDLDRTACRKLMSRARFKPALDAGGNATASTYSGGVTWKLPAE